MLRLSFTLSPLCNSASTSVLYSPHKSLPHYCTFSNLLREIHSHCAAESFQIPTELLKWKPGPAALQYEMAQEASRYFLLSSINKVQFIFTEIRVINWSKEIQAQERRHTLIFSPSQSSLPEHFQFRMQNEAVSSLREVMFFQACKNCPTKDVIFWLLSGCILRIYKIVSRGFPRCYIL